VKKAWVVGSIVALHTVVIGALIFSGGCGTTGQTPPPEVAPVVMPPTVEPPPPVVVPPPPPTIELPPAAELTTKKYTVKSGDSLSMIAKRFNVSRADLMKLNKLSDPNKIRVGQKLTLPGYVNLNAPAPVVHKTRKAAPAVVAGGSTYTVVSGDSLGGIAYRHKTTVKAIKQVNNMTSDRISIGQKLALPKGAAAVSKPEVAPAVTEEAAPVEAVVAPEGAPETVVPMEAPKSNEVLHVVEPNQDLNSIAMMYGVRAEEIIRLNTLASPDVKVGQTLKIPPPVE
jgi:LysM repeat protein